jgi:hypothetical protein
MTDLIERLHDHARNVGGDDSFERLYGSEANEAADEIAALRARVAVLEEMLVAEREDNLWNAYNVGHVRDGKWNHLCMSDGEWLARECGFNVSDCRFDDEEIRNAIPKVARAIISKQEPGRVEVVDEGESGNAGLR